MHKRIYIAVIAFMFFIGILVLQLFFSKGNLIEQRNVAQQIAEYEFKIDSLKQIIEERTQEIERLQHDSLYKEEILRTRYGMSLEGEKVFQMVK
ncbi:MULTISPECIES: septum formation initiator family protein [Fibrobacter]|uniref:FtsB family cell division protein n=1 Tax=Fibrobacter TaxID=832 RepID=UPI0015669445|nr:MULTISPECIES: septum formation initiator family protein [Fibrobacter]MBR4784469.1 septum formation initiator family protein [Fibrobacter sp.]